MVRAPESHSHDRERRRSCASLFNTVAVWPPVCLFVSLSLCVSISVSLSLPIFLFCRCTSVSFVNLHFPQCLAPALLLVDCLERRLTFEIDDPPLVRVAETGDTKQR